MSNYKITPIPVVDIQSLLGNNFVELFQTEMSAYIAPYRKNILRGRPLSMGQELWEYAVADSIPGAEWNGAGHSMLDVKLGENTGIDVKTVGRNKKSNSTAEASMFQNFNQDAKTAFKNKDSKGIWDIYIDGWTTKVDLFDEYYLLGIIREKETINCSLCCFKVSKGNIPFLEDLCNYTGKFIKISGLADPDFISIRYYNSKSRLEIQFLKKCWTDPEYCLPIFKY